MRPRAQKYVTLDGLHSERDQIQWYWRMVAFASTWMILGGFLTLPASFDTDPQLRVSKSVLSIFSVALLTAGFSFTALLCFAVRNPLFQADVIFLPALTACALGLLTVFYDFLISSRYTWNVAALLVTIAASLSSIIYGCLLLWTHRQIGRVRQRGPAMNMTVPLRPASIGSGGMWQEPTYYENYVRNMYPSSANSQTPPSGGGWDPNMITEEEMQRQQMLMLLLKNDQPPTPDPSQSTFRIDWQGQEQEDPNMPPRNGYYAPQSAGGYQSAYPQTAYPPQSAHTLWSSQELRPWDGIWRGGDRRGRMSLSRDQSGYRRPTSREDRDQRRREIEMGR